MGSLEEEEGDGDEVEEDAADKVEDVTPVPSERQFFPPELLLLLFPPPEVDMDVAAACCMPAIPHRGDSFM